MFRFIAPDDKSTVINERGVTIRSVGRTTKEYGSEDKKVWFYVELDDINSPKVFIYIQKNHSWEKPHDNEIITESEMENIKNDFREAYKIIIPSSKGIEFVQE
jgi:hypothetical protein